MSSPSEGRAAAVGMFDGVHRGHRYLLQRLVEVAARERLRPVAVTFEEHPLTVIAPGRAPAMLTTLRQRVTMLSLAGMHQVLLMPFTQQLQRMTAAQFMQMLRDRYDVRALVQGFNNRLGCDAEADYEAAARQAGIALYRATEYDGASVSSSQIRRALADGDLDRANDLLGYSYTLEGTVAHGQHLGTTLGFPTANVDTEQLLPANGVYAALATVDGSTYGAVCNIGMRPTVKKNNKTATLECHLLDFDGYIYGDKISVTLLKRLRPEMAFPDLEHLKRQISSDITFTRQYLSTL